ncbi:MAG: hypothetical protein ACI88A_004616 [Paraglaciecola sp.]|jgi:hypothetical protein
MTKKILKYLMLLVLLPVICFAQPIEIKESAPEVYIVKKGDTLWDISNLYLYQPWLWPQLWRTNTHITNPHLIYPGDELRLYTNDKGEAVLEVVRETPKTEIKISPSGDKTFKAAEPIPALPWSVIKPYVEHDMIMTQENYDKHPYILGNQDGAVHFATDDLVLSKSVRGRAKSYRVIRQQNEIHDLEGNFLGVQVRHVADAEPFESKLDKQILVKIKQASLEIKRGDKLIPATEVHPATIILHAAEAQRGYIIDDLEQHNLLGKYNVVVLDLGSSDVSAGTVMGIYAQGPKIIDSEQPRYEGENNFLRSAFSVDDEIAQPALKVGELVVFKVFEKASYALITRSAKIIRKGAIVAKP